MKTVFSIWKQTERVTRLQRHIPSMMDLEESIRHNDTGYI